MSARELLGIGEDHVLVGERSRKGVHWQEGVATYTALDGLSAAVAAAFADRPNVRRRGVEVRLDPALVQLRTLTGLPGLSQRDLHGFVEHQRERFFRPTGAGVVISVRWTESPEGARAARTALVDAELLAAVEDGLEQVGRFARDFLVPPGHDGEPPLEFETAALAARRAREARRRVSTAALLALFGWAVAAGAYLADLHRDQRALGAEWEALQGPLARLEEVASRLERFRPLVDVVRRQGSEDHWLVPRLLEVAAALPDSCHLLSLTAERSGPMTIEVHGADAVIAVQALSAVSFGDTRLQSQPTEEAENGVTLQRFVIALEPAP